MTIAERGHDTPVMTSTTRVGVPRDWAGSAALLGDGSAVGCLLPDGGTPTVTTSADGAEVVAQSTQEIRLEDYDSQWGEESAGLWASREPGGTWFVALLPSPGDVPSGLAGARWRTVVVKTPESRVRTVTPLPSQVLGPHDRPDGRGGDRPPGGAALRGRVASRGPGVSWWANARLAARYASYVGAPAAVFLIWATWSTDSRGRDGWLDRLGDPNGFYGLAGDLIRPGSSSGPGRREERMRLRRSGRSRTRPQSAG
ncbi:hypothetical protein ACQPZZ_03900 [Microbispora sp. CA-135349]|uniref:hypothetical protein n=1 Tax=Microbispora sp. CA-135349 TaxID=3239953 RepID=UPI003D8AF320